VAQVLGENPVVAAREDGYRAGAQASQFRQTGGVFKNVDRIELDPTDREKLFEFQATRSTRLPESLQARDVGHG
jgi:hypothetical protein